MKMKNFIIAAAIATLGFNVQADANLTIGDANYLGLIDDGIPSNAVDEVRYINNLITLAAGQGNTNIANPPPPPGTFETYNRVGSTLAGPFDMATTTDSVKDESGNDTANVAGTYQYVLAKYGNDGSRVWYFDGGITGEICIPPNFNGSTGSAVSHISLYNLIAGEEVPEPASIALMGLGGLLAGYGLRRRKAAKTS